MKNILIASLIFFSALFVAQAQSTTNSALPDQKQNQLFSSLSDSTLIVEPKVENVWDHLTIISDSRIDTLLQIHREENQRKKSIRGFRVQIFQTDNKKQADQVRTRFLARYPDQKAYPKFEDPLFKVRVGDFRTRSEALKLSNQIKGEFPNPFIVEDDINFPDLIKD